MSVTLHEGTTFVVSDEGGDFEPEADGGLFHLDTRFLSRHELRLDGRAPVVLQATVRYANEAFHFLTNPELRRVRRSTLGIVLHRQVGDGLRETVEIENYSGATARFTVTLSFGADFEYILTVKQHATSQHATSDGVQWTPRVQADVRGGQRVEVQLDEGGTPHRTTVAFDPAPDQLAPGEARFAVALAPRARWRAEVEVSPSIGDDRTRRATVRPGASRAALDRRRALERAMPSLASDHPVLPRAFAQATRDLAALRIKADGVAGEDGGGGEYAIAAGIPWYMDLFGRDSLISSYEAMQHDPALARGTLDALAKLQGTKRDRVSEEAPGKILHEYRRGPLTPAARKLIPTYPYYGTIDATPLFLITLSEYVRATGDLAFARDRWANVEAAVSWMRDDGDRDGDGFLEYERDSDVGLVNQGWKDSNDSVRFRDGRIASPSIALVEVQGYAYAARRRTAELARHLGHGAEAERLEEEASALRRRIREKYWLADRRYFAEALDGRKQRVDSLTSNPGHLLWTGAVDRADARAIAEVLLGDEMFSGFGVRTMGDREGGYNPVSYHDGSVWPHDNAILLSGLARYGLRDEAVKLAAALLGALGQLPDAEPPELFCGYSAKEYGTPVHYPTACRPQAWASGAVLLIVRSVLGLEVDALARVVSISPLPIPGLSRLEMVHVPVGEGHVDVTVRVDGGGATRAEVNGLPKGWRRVDPTYDD